MFLKPYKSKPKSNLKTSDKKKLLTRVSNQCNVDKEQTGFSAGKVSVSCGKITSFGGEMFSCYFEENECLMLENRGGTLGWVFWYKIF